MEKFIGFITSILLICFYFFYYRSEQITKSEDIAITIIVFTPFVYFIGGFIKKKFFNK
jgi:hypothetical protein